MYNRYIRNDYGTYTRILEDDGKNRRPQNVTPSGDAPHNAPERSPTDNASEHPMTGDAPPMGNAPPHRPPPNPPQDGVLNGFLSHFEHVETGDLLILVLLFMLYREGADEELLVALGLLLIL